MKATTLIGIFALLLLVSPAGSQVPDDNVIVPGLRIGKWTLETPVDDLLQSFGPMVGLTLPPGPLYQAGFTLITWTTGPVSGLTRDRKRVEMLFTTSRAEAYRTEKAVGLGAAGSTVTEAYGAPGARAPANPGIVVYDEMGIAFNMSNDRVSAIFVFRPKTAAAIWRL